MQTVKRSAHPLEFQGKVKNFSDFWNTLWLCFFFYLRKRRKNLTKYWTRKPGIHIYFSAFAALKSILRHIFILTQLCFHKVKQEIVSLLVCQMGIRVLNLTKKLLENLKIQSVPHSPCFTRVKAPKNSEIYKYNIVSFLWQASFLLNLHSTLHRKSTQTHKQNT